MLGSDDGGEVEDGGAFGVEERKREAEQLVEQVKKRRWEADDRIEQRRGWLGFGGRRRKRR